MSDYTLFRDFRSNLSVSNAADISTKYYNITARLNLDFWDLESDVRHSLQIGSYGRRTAIDGISDLDMVFEIPESDYKRYKAVAGNGPSVMLQEVRESLLKRYPKTDVRADGQIVGVNFTGYRVEVLPAFLDAEGNYIHGDTNDGGAWKTTKPRPEIAAVAELDKETNGNLKDICKMLRAWKNKCGASMGGLLIDTLAYNFFEGERSFDEASYGDFPQLFVALFEHLKDLPEQEYWLAPGSNQRVKCRNKFQRKAGKAAKRCAEALELDTEEKRAKTWRKVFGRKFPLVQTLTEAVAKRDASPLDEEFIEDQFPVDIRYNIELDCQIREENRFLELLRAKLKRREKIPVGRSLRFFVSACDVPGDYETRWKVRNRGPEAVRTNQQRGEISKDKGGRERNESTSFSGDHYVEVYAIKDGVCVARERIAVPI